MPDIYAKDSTLMFKKYIRHLSPNARFALSGLLVKVQANHTTAVTETLFRECSSVPDKRIFNYATVYITFALHNGAQCTSVV